MIQKGQLSQQLEDTYAAIRKARLDWEAYDSRYRSQLPKLERTRELLYMHMHQIDQELEARIAAGSRAASEITGEESDRILSAVRRFHQQREDNYRSYQMAEQKLNDYMDENEKAYRRRTDQHEEAIATLTRECRQLEEKMATDKEKGKDVW